VMLRFAERRKITLIIPEIIFEVFQRLTTPYYITIHQRHRQTDGQLIMA